MTLPISRLLLAVLAVVAIAVGIDNMERPLANPDEGRYSEISREMAATGDWVTPRLNGLKYFEKPPLQYWASALSFRLFGENEVSRPPCTWGSAGCSRCCLRPTRHRLWMRERVRHGWCCSRVPTSWRSAAS